MTVKLIVTDMDETFLRANKTYDIEKANRVFGQLAQREIIFAIASGNYIPLPESYFSDDLLKNLYLAGDDGNMLKNYHEILRTCPLNRKDAQDIFHFMEDKEGYYPIYSTGEKAYVKGPVPKDIIGEIEVYYKGFEEIHHFQEVPEEKEIIKMEAYCTHTLEEIKEVMQEIEREFQGVSSVTSGENWLDVYHKDGGKGEAVKFLQKRYGLSKEDTMCFGDSLNDRSMMKQAKYSVAMENADSELKKHCRFEIGLSENQDVLAVLEAYLESGNLDFLENFRMR